MKLALNGALTLGTRDGANLEIGEAVGEENVFFFGLSAGEVAERRQHGHDPNAYCAADDHLREVLDMVRNGYFSPDDPHRFAGLIDGMLNGGDYFMVLADFAAYVACQDRVDEVYRNPAEWARRAILNIAGMPRFSSDRTIREYAEDIWEISQICPVPSPNQAA
jgi:starch phosphorylase